MFTYQRDALPISKRRRWRRLSAKYDALRKAGDVCARARRDTHARERTTTRRACGRLRYAVGLDDENTRASAFAGACSVLRTIVMTGDHARTVAHARRTSSSAKRTHLPLSEAFCLQRSISPLPGRVEQKRYWRVPKHLRIPADPFLSAHASWQSMPATIEIIADIL